MAKKTPSKSPVSGRFGSAGVLSSGSHQPKVIKNPPSMAGRRAGSRAKAYGDR